MTKIKDFSKKQSNRSYNYGCSFGKNGKYCDPCGISYQPVNLRIVGGIPAEPHSFPAQVTPAFSQKLIKNHLKKKTFMYLGIYSHFIFCRKIH